MNEKWAKNKENGPKYEINTAGTSSHGQTTQRVTRACPCRAQVESNSEKANFMGS